MKQIITNDNSVTYFNEEFQETYHSTSGAEEESIKKYAEQSELEIKSKTGDITILDICFGLGYNSAAAIDKILEYNPNCKINIFGLENDLNILNKILEINSNFKSYKLIQEAIKNKLHLFRENFEIDIILGDAVQTIHKINKKVDLVFLDPFSPKKCPELWTEEFFKSIKHKCNSDAILTTYSCASKVKQNLQNAGFIVKDGPCIGRRSPSTIAYLNQNDRTKK